MFCHLFDISDEDLRVQEQCVSRQIAVSRRPNLRSWWREIFLSYSNLENRSNEVHLIFILFLDVQASFLNEKSVVSVPLNRLVYGSVDPYP